MMLLSLFVAAVAAACDCSYTSFAKSVQNGSPDVVYVMGVPVESSFKTVKAQLDTTVHTFDLSSVVFLTKQPFFRVTNNKLKIGYRSGQSDCGYDSPPFTWGENAIFALTRSKFEIVNPEGSKVAKMPPALSSSAQARADAQLFWPVSPSCFPTSSDFEPGSGQCLLVSNCMERNKYGGNYWKSIPYTQTDVSKANCFNYPKDVMCCAFDGPDEDIEVPDVDDVDPVASVSIDVQFVLGGCRHAVMQAATSFASSDGFREPLSAASSQALSAALPRLQRAYPSVDFAQAIRNLPVYKCTTNCGSGRCVDGTCVCPLPYTGPMCADKLPSKVTVSNIIPGGKGTDVWMFGTKRTIEFTVADYNPTMDIYRVDVNLVDKSGVSWCVVKSTTSPKLFYTQGIAVANLTKSYYENGMKSTFTVKFDVDLYGGDCARASSKWVLELEAFTVDNKESKDFLPVSGVQFQTAYSGCAYNGIVGECMPAGVCANMDSLVPLSTFIGSDAGNDICNVAKSPLASTICCVPDLRAVSAPRLGAFVFTSPAANNEAFIYAGSKIDVHWIFQPNLNKNAACKSLTASSSFTLELIKKPAVSVLGWFTSDEVAKSWPVSSVVNNGDGRGRLSIEIVLDAGKKVVDGTHYFLQAKFSDDCKFATRSFTLEAPSCRADNKRTFLGQCLPAGDCLESKISGFCPGIAGNNVQCCYKPRKNMSPSFRDADGGGEGGALEDAAVAPVLTALLVLVAVLAPLF